MCNKYIKDTKKRAQEAMHSIISAKAQHKEDFFI